MHWLIYKWYSLIWQQYNKIKGLHYSLEQPQSKNMKLGTNDNRHNWKEVIEKDKSIDEMEWQMQ